MTAPEPQGDNTATSNVRLGLGAALVILIAVGVLVAIRFDASEESDTTARGTTTTAPADEGAGDTGGDDLDATPVADPASTVTAAQLDGLAFTDVTAEAGLARRHADLALAADLSMTSGAAAADIDGDGDIDLYVTRVGLPNSLYRNDGDGTFTDIAIDAGVDRTPPPGGYQGSGAAAFADVDGDGCLDLYVAGAGNGVESGEGALFVNDCAGRFVDETAARGVALPATTANLGAQGHGVTFADYDRDGFLDLLVLHWDPAFLGGTAQQTAFQEFPEPDSLCQRTAANRAAGADRTPVAGPNRSRLFRNDGTGRFVDVTAQVGLPFERIAAFTGEFVDVDADGWDDLLLTGDFCTSALFRNDGGTRFTEVTERAGVATDENGMGSVVRDIDGDGRPDWFVTSIDLRTESGACPTRPGNTGCSGNRLYLNDGDGTFSDATDTYGVRDGWWGWGAAIEDFSNDGRLSVIQTNGYVGEDSPRDRYITDPTRLWVSPAGPEPDEGAPILAEAAAPAGLTTDRVGHALVPFDYDDDGDLDVFIANYGDEPNLYRNDSPPERHWLRVRLDDPTRPGNRAGIGAKVVVTPSGGGRSTTGWITTAGSYESQRPAEFHVGLGDVDAVERVEVWWPGAAVPQVVTTVEVDGVLTITRA